MFKSIYPYSGEVVAEYEEDAAPLQKVEKAHQVFSTWKTSP